MKNKIASRVAVVELPGVNKNDLEIEAKENTLSSASGSFSSPASNR